VKSLNIPFIIIFQYVFNAGFDIFGFINI